MYFKYSAFILSSSHNYWFRYCTCVWMISYIYRMFAFDNDLSHFIILFLVVAFSFQPREIPLTFVVKLVVLNFLSFCFKTFDFSIDSE